MAKAPSTLTLLLQQNRAVGVGAGEALPPAVMSAPHPPRCLRAPPVVAHRPYQGCWNKLPAPTPSGARALNVGTEMEKKNKIIITPKPNLF